MIGELTTHLWQSTVFALAAGGLTLAFRRNRAKVRYGLWLSASLKFFMPFSFLIRLGGRLGWAPAAHRIALPDVSFAMLRITQPFPQPLSLAPAAAATANWTQSAILAVWLCGLLAIAMFRLRLWLRVRAAVRAGTPLPIPAPVEIRSAPGLLEPGVVGCLRPILLLPEGILERLTPSQLEAVLAHELCHVRRRDNLFAAAHMLVEAVFWFHPLVWWIGARLVEERERACDEGVLSLGSEPRTYADAILNVCKLYVESPLCCVSGVTGANLKRRIEAIMTNRTGQGLTRARKLLLAGAGVAALAGPIGVGVLIGVGNAPVIRAQPPAADPPPQAPAPQTASAQATAPIAAPAAPVKYQDRRLVALLFDLDTMTSDEQSKARQNAANWVQKMQPADLAAVMAVNNDGVRVVQDFTDDQAVLQSAIGQLAGSGSSAPSASLRLSRIETAARLLGALPQRKSLLYFAGGVEQAKADDPAGLKSAIDAAMQSNVAIFPVDVQNPASQILPLPAGGGRSMGAAPASAMARTYLRHGPPDRVDQTNSGTQVWHYNYLENFHSSVEFEFTGNGRGLNGEHINWPPPLATYTGVPGAPQDSAIAGSIAGLPGGHATLQVYPAGELQMLTVPLEGLSGRISLFGRINSLPATVTAGGTAAAFIEVFVPDDIPVSARPYQTSFLLEAGSYVCTLRVKDNATGQVYAETINFEVK